MMRDVLLPSFAIVALAFVITICIKGLHDGIKANEKLYEAYKTKCDTLGGITATSFDGRVICVKELK